LSLEEGNALEEGNISIDLNTRTMRVQQSLLAEHPSRDSINLFNIISVCLYSFY